MNQIHQLKERRKVLIDYLKMKAEMEDWHGVRDACVDIELIDAQIKLLTELL